MIFNSVTYLVFLGVCVGLYWQLPLRLRQWLIFIASLCFYGFWRLDFLALVLFSAAVDFYVSLRLYRSDRSVERKAWLSASLAINLGLLFYFKYLAFTLDNTATVAQQLGLDWNPVFKVILPLGISFYTFQTISYTIDVYRKQLEPLRDFVVYGCYVTFFPQLVAGPILRASEVVQQLTARQRFGIDHLVVGVRRILFGLLLKVGFADNIADLVDAGFSQSSNNLFALDVWTLAFLFGFQIYFDFAGYSHIALGSSRLMGIVFPENFRFPYLASSPRDFWRRWHISLSSWIRDYLYLPLLGVAGRGSSEGGIGQDRAQGPARTRALFLAWGIMGLWHGAGWTFLWWGLYHAAVVYLHRQLGPKVPWPNGLAGKALSWAVTLPVMMLGWIPFRAASPAQTLALWGKVLDPSAYGSLGMRENTYLITAVILALVTIAGLIHPYLDSELISKRRLLWMPAQILVYAALTAVVLTFLRPVKQFIYFQF